MNALPKPRPSRPTPWLSDEEIALVRAQFARIGQDADAFARDFYDALFSIAPLVRAMFRGPMPEQRTKLLRMLALLMSQLHAPEAMAAPLAELGERHRGYGVLSLDYDKVGEALMRALHKHLGDDFNEATRAAWGKAYFFIASSMHKMPA